MALKTYEERVIFFDPNFYPMLYVDKWSDEDEDWINAERFSADTNREVLREARLLKRRCEMSQDLYTLRVYLREAR